VPPVKFAPRSLRDLARLHGFLAEKSPEAARRAIGAIRKGLKLLGRHPEMGRPVEELPVEFREWVIPFGDGAYVAIYRFDGREVVVLAIRHGREAGY
jgi:plasmid stabilization system protein ParE